jgi:hypothetical protein
LFTTAQAVCRCVTAGSIPFIVFRRLRQPHLFFLPLFAPLVTLMKHTCLLLHWNLAKPVVLVLACLAPSVATLCCKSSPPSHTPVSLYNRTRRAYETSTLYRECKLRGSLFRDRVLILLPKEKIFSRFEGVWNVSNDSGNLGIFYVTNFRIVWHALVADNFSISVPYGQMVRVLRGFT